VLTAAGVLLVAIGNVAASRGSWWAEAAFWVGLVVIVVPVGLRIFTLPPSRAERISLILLLAIGLYLCKVVHDPLRVGSYDEFLHIRTAQDIVATGRLFSPNTLLGVSPYYPGLELAATALSETSGLSIFDSGVLMLGGVRIVFALALFLLFETVTKDSRVAGIATLIYMLNPKFLYFDSQFAYETLALPLTALVIYAVRRRGHARFSERTGMTLLILLGIAAVVTTHHVTSLMLAGFLGLWSIVSLTIVRRVPVRSAPGRFAIVTVGAIAVWVLLVATSAVGYLAPAITQTVAELGRLMAGELTARNLFTSRSGSSAPVWEQLVGFASAGLILALLPPGLVAIGRRYRHDATAVAMGLVAILYPLTLVARFTRVGADVSTRTSEFLFLGIGLVLAAAVAGPSIQGRFRKARMAALASGLSVLLVGGVIVGIPPFARLPGPYLVSADGRSVEGEGIAASTWARVALGPGNRFVADRVNRVLLSVYGSQTLVTTYAERVPVRRLYLAPEIGPRERQIAAQADIRFLLVDQRLTTGLPVVGHYFDRGEETELGVRRVPLAPALLAKFDRLPSISRIFDSGNIRIYDVGSLSREQ
jgi:hypothetical protein